MRSHLTLLTLLCLATATVAGASPFYLTGKLGSTSLDADYGQSFTQSVRGDDDGWSLGVGLETGRYLAFQAEYHDLGIARGGGSPCNDGEEACILILVPVEAETTALSLSALPQLPVTERLRLYGKLGVVSLDTEVSELRDGSLRRIAGFDGEELLYGAGARYRVSGPFALFTEYERLSDDFQTVSFGATLGF